MKTKAIISLLISIIIFFVVFSFYFNSGKFCYQLPITFSFSNLPITEVKIENHTYPLEIDLGSKTFLSLRENILSTLHKEEDVIVSWKDAKGRQYESMSYRLPKINIGGLPLENIIVEQENDEFIASNIIYDPQHRPVEERIYEKYGSVGMLILEKTNLLFDFPNSIAFATNDASLLHKKGYDLKEMIPINMETGQMGCIIKIQTDFGLLRLGLDTGASETIIRRELVQNNDIKIDWRNQPYSTTSKFSAEGTDFGETQLFLFDFSDEFPCDGVIGMAFLKNHPFYVDYQNKLIYIKK